MSLPTKFELNLISSLSVNVQQLNSYCSTKGQQTAGIQQSMSKSLSGLGARNEFTYQILAQYEQWFVCKCTETTRNN